MSGNGQKIIDALDEIIASLKPGGPRVRIDSYRVENGVATLVRRQRPKPALRVIEGGKS